MSPATGATLIRQARGSDHAELYRICLLTADIGADATPLYDDPELVGHLYLGGYLAHAPRFCVVADDAHGIAGYAVGTPDSRAFEFTLERLWWPSLRSRYDGRTFAPTSRDGELLALLARPDRADPSLVTSYPAHFHIDLHPRAQGRGLGRALAAELCRRLSAAGAPGVHVSVDGRNRRAIGFYERIGMTPVHVETWGVVMAMDLTGPDEGEEQ